MTAHTKPHQSNPKSRRNLITLSILALFVAASFLFSFTHIGDEVAASAIESGPTT
ncbi:hypothetical protein V6617_18465 (plasmid) [Pelagibacterium nitratireducens]|jgi:hypothetical protein|uniref:Uncharacterized protein n=1 Tax=Pelagibacterium nitratireducens TaxID=1046114 RepID=A0ABZ2I4U1_9HYPH|tara:strand:- start:17 stop:181 length:165 start_codon:yes stop_codon:yes gene_type:complete